MESFDQMRARAAVEGVERAGFLLQVLTREPAVSQRGQPRRLRDTLRIYRNCAYWARRLNVGYAPPAEAHALARSLDPSIT